MSSIPLLNIYIENPLMLKIISGGQIDPTLFPYARTRTPLSQLPPYPITPYPECCKFVSPFVGFILIFGQSLQNHV